MNEKVSISICMATYNGDKYIKAQIDSILSQMAENDELIISDDSSTDQTIYIIEQYNDSRICLYKDNKFHDPIYNFENALKKASRDIITLSDQDDIWLDGKLNLIRKHFIEYQNLSLIVMDNYVTDEFLNITHDSLFKVISSGPGLLKNFKKNTYLGCNLAFTSDLLRYIMPFPKGIPMHDIWIGLVAQLFGDIAFYNKKTILFRRHTTNATKMYNNLGQKIIWRFILIYHLFKRVIKHKLMYGENK